MELTNAKEAREKAELEAHVQAEQVKIRQEQRQKVEEQQKLLEEKVAKAKKLEKRKLLSKLYISTMIKK